MKPVFIEETLFRLQEIIDSTSAGRMDNSRVNEVTDEIEKSLKAYKDNNENKILFYGASVIVVALSIILTFKTMTSWPLMFMVIWFGGFMYYRVHERSLIVKNITKFSKVKYDDPLTNITYLMSAIDLKIGRKTVLKYFLSVMISSSVMMAHFLFVDTTFWINLGLFTGAIIVSFFFWNSFYREDLTALISMKNKLHQLENQIILSSSQQTEEE